MANEKRVADYEDHAHVATPGSPTAGYLRTYVKSDNKFYKKTSAGAESEIGAAGIGGSTGSTDNAILVANGTGGSTLESAVATLNPATGVMALASISEGANYVGFGAENNVTLDTNGRFNAAGIAHAVIQAFSGTADDLVSITGISDIGRRIILRGLAGHTITVKHNDAGSTVKILLNGDTDVVLDSDNPLLLVLTETTKWSQVYDSGGVSLPVSIANGGTGQITQTAAMDALSPTTTKGDLLVDNGTNVVRKAAGANGKILSFDNAQSDGIKYVGGLIEIVAPTQLGSSQTTITLSNIPAIFQDLILVVKGRSTSTGTVISLTFNADTGANYSRNSSAISSAGAETSVVSNNQTAALCGSVSPSSSTAGYFGGTHIHIQSYAETTISRNIFFHGMKFTNATDHTRFEGSIAWENVSNAISSIELNLDAGDWDTGTIYALYGMGMAS